MNDPAPDPFTQLILYLEGDLNPSETAFIKDQLTRDPALKAEYENLLIAQKSIRLFGLKQDIGNILTEIKSAGSSNRRDQATTGKLRPLFRSVFAIAAILLLFIGISTYRYFSISPEKLYHQEFQSFQLGNLRSADTLTQSLAERFYRAKDYKQVIAVVSDQNVRTVQETFLAAVSNLELGSTKNAIEQFVAMLRGSAPDSGSVYRDAAEYYLALAYLRDYQYGPCLGLMRSIAGRPGHLYAERITGSLIRKVEDLK